MFIVALNGPSEAELAPPTHKVTNTDAHRKNRARPTSKSKTQSIKDTERFFSKPPRWQTQGTCRGTEAVMKILLQTAEA